MRNGGGPHDMARSPTHQWAEGGPSFEETLKEAQTVAEAQMAEDGSEMPTQPRATAGPPGWAKLFMKATSKALPSGPPLSGAYDGSMDGYRVKESHTIDEVVQAMDDFDDSSSSTTIERTPSPTRPSPQEEEVEYPPQPELRVLTFNSVEDMRANLELEGKPLTDKQIDGIIWGLAPDNQKFKLRKGTDGEHRWQDAKECIFPQTGGLIRIIEQNQFEELERRRAQTTDCKIPE